jgi:hypothetical protein
MTTPAIRSINHFGNVVLAIEAREISYEAEKAGGNKVVCCGRMPLGSDDRVHRHADAYGLPRSDRATQVAE